MKLSQLFPTQKNLWRLQGEVDRLRKELAILRAQNESMRAGMRRCVTCEYRLDFKQRQGSETPVSLRSAVDEQ